MWDILYSAGCARRERRTYVYYHDESARSYYLSGSEHVRELERKSKTSVLYKHVRSAHKHEEDQVKFGMKMVGKFNRALGRIIDESSQEESKIHLQISYYTLKLSFTDLLLKERYMKIIK